MMLGFQQKGPDLQNATRTILSIASARERFEQVFYGASRCFQGLRAAYPISKFERDLKRQGAGFIGLCLAVMSDGGVGFGTRGFLTPSQRRLPALGEARTNTISIDSRPTRLGTPGTPGSFRCHLPAKWDTGLDFTSSGGMSRSGRGARGCGKR